MSNFEDGNFSGGVDCQSLEVFGLARFYGPVVTIAPPVPSSPIITTLVVGTGTGEFASIPVAVQQIPNPIPPGRFWIIDNGGTTEALDGYVLPAFKGPSVLRNDFSKRFWHLYGLVTIEADPENVPLVPASDSIITPTDGPFAGPPTITNDPVSNQVTITIGVARANWTNANLKGKFLVGAAPGVEQFEILEVTTTTLLIASDFAPTFPADIMQNTAHLTTSVDGTISAVGCDSISFHGQEILSAGPGFTGVYCDGMGTSIFELCTLQNPYIQNVGVLQSKVLACHIFGDFIILGQNSVIFRSCFFDNCTGVGFMDSLSANTQYRNCGWEACDPIEPRGFVPFSGEFAQPVQFFSMENCRVKDSLAEGAKLHGLAGRLLNVDFQGAQADGLVLDHGVGLFTLENVGSTVPNGAGGAGYGLLVNDGLAAKPDAATYGSAFPLTGFDGDMKVGNGLTRTWANYTTGADGRPPLLELDYTTLALAAGTFSDAAPAPAFLVGTGSKVFS